MARAQTRYENTSDERIFDTSVCHARFRKVRVDPHRKRDFDEHRRLGFDSNRRIEARMKGVMFRKGHAVGFRQVILENVDDVMEKHDWPDMGSAKVPDAYAKQDIRGWEGRWGKDRAFQERWNLPKKRASPQRKGAVVGTLEEGPIKDAIEYTMTSGTAEAAKDAADFMKETARVEAAKRYAEYKPKIEPTVDKVQKYYEEAPEEVKAKVREYKERIDEAVMKPTASSKKKAFALNEYALTLMEMKKYDLALNYFEKAITLDPTEETYLTNKARCIDWISYREKGGN